MNISDLLTRDSILLARKAHSYSDALDALSVHLSYLTELRPQQISQVLHERESKGSTALGNGIALPHARIEGLTKTYCVFMHLATPIDAAAADNLPVDIICAFLAPESDTTHYVRAVGKIATILRSADNRDTLRSNDKEVIYNTLTAEDS